MSSDKFTGTPPFKPSMFQEPPPIPYDRQPSDLVLMLEVIMRRDESLKRFNHVFEANKNELQFNAKAEPGSPRLQQIQCICGRITSFLPRKHKDSLCHVCDCGTWHTILWRGEKSLEERMEDRDIRLEMAGVNPFTKSAPSWLERIFEKTKMKHL